MKPNQTDPAKNGDGAKSIALPASAVLRRDSDDGTDTGAGHATLELTGSWTLREDLPHLSDLAASLAEFPPVRHLSFDARPTVWDTGLLRFVLRILDHAEHNEITVDRSGLPAGLLRLVALARAVPEKADARRHAARVSFLGLVGKDALAAWRGAVEMTRFVGEVTAAFGRLLVGRAQMRGSDLLLILQETGAQALPIVSLISVLVGLILAFVGAVQLQQFGAEIYVADMVALGMAREMGAMMTAIIMAGRTGAAFAAQLGSMKVNEEIDALTTMGIPPVEFLVLPRMLALFLMMPLLCAYSIFLGLVGGMVVSVAMLEITLTQYVNETLIAVDLVDFNIGMFKSGIFGILVALSGCLRGMQCGGSSAAVGEATTAAVVTSIVWIVVADSLVTVITTILNI